MGDKAANQLVEFAEKQKKSDQATTTFGCPHDKQSLQQSISIGKNGPMALEDVSYLEIMSHFDRERIPERVVHAKGAAAFGYFETTHDITQYTKLAPFAAVGKKTPMAVRFSTVGGELGSADTVRDPRGFAMKFYTEEGNWDLVGNNTPIFFIRDPILFPDFIHTQKRNPKTNLKDPNMFWDFISLRPETTHQVSFLFSDRGIPDGHRHMNGYGSHTYKMINKDGDPIFCKFHFKTDQGSKNIPVDKAGLISGSDPDYSRRDLYNAIEEGNFPSWSLEIQVMTLEQAEKYRWNPFDVTKVWLHADHPPIPVGKMVLNRNPENFFQEVEQLAFSPSSFIPGIQPSQDRMLQGRLFSYHDTHLHRLGTNYGQLEVNRPKCAVRNYERDGPACTYNQGGAPNYHPNSFNGPVETASTAAPSYKAAGDVMRHDSADDDNFSQVNRFWNHTLNEEERDRLASNIAGHLKDAIVRIQKKAVANFAQADPDYGNRIQKKLDEYNKK